tara:strand:+ start:199 stop:408 length:210 start_codon:yes stop_codon:yes gene_type:complete
MDLTNILLGLILIALVVIMFQLSQKETQEMIWKSIGEFFAFFFTFGGFFVIVVGTISFIFLFKLFTGQL